MNTVQALILVKAYAQFESQAPLMSAQPKSNLRNAGNIFSRFLFVFCFGIGQGFFAEITLGPSYGIMLLFGVLSGWILGAVFLFMEPFRRFSGAILVSISFIFVILSLAVPTLANLIEPRRFSVPGPVLEVAQGQDAKPMITYSPHGDFWSITFEIQGHPESLLEWLGGELSNQDWSVTSSSGLPEGKEYYTNKGYQSFGRTFSKEVSNTEKRRPDLYVAAKMYPEERTEFFIHQDVDPLIFPILLSICYVLLISALLVYGLLRAFRQWRH